MTEFTYCTGFWGMDYIFTTDVYYGFTSIIFRQENQ